MKLFVVILFVYVSLISAKHLASLRELIGETAVKPDDENENTTMPEPKLEDYAEAENPSGISTRADLRVTITVGETGFAYTLNGLTRNGEKIVVGGKYYNNPRTYSGNALLYMNIESTIDYIEFGYRDNNMEVYVENTGSRQFYFEVVPPDQIPVDHLRIGQINATSIFVWGPSRHNRYH